jgi:hypothetical protein
MSNIFVYDTKRILDIDIIFLLDSIITSLFCPKSIFFKLFLIFQVSFYILTSFLQDYWKYFISIAI